MKASPIIFMSFGLMVVSVLVIFVTTGVISPSIAGLNSSPQLAQIIEIETELLKQWQQSNGLKQTLAYKSTGYEVSLLQRMLSQDTIIYPEREVTGYYGDLTMKAVIQFQKEYNLLVTGVVDRVTKEKLNEVFLSHLCPVPEVMYPDFTLRKITNELVLPVDFVPPALVNISDKVKTVGVICVSQKIEEDLTLLIEDAEEDGVILAVTSGYRKPEIQKYLYDYWVDLEGPEAFDEIAKPGASEHQLGTTVDFTDSSIDYAGVDNRFASSTGGLWLQDNAYKYGFIMSYPEGKKDVTRYEYEPWHWRYVGKTIAKDLRRRELTFNEM